MKRTLLFAALVAAAPMGASALTRVEDRTRFLEIVEGRDLTRPLTRLQVNGNGTITGTGGGRAISGSWNWDEGYFCRTLNWGARELGENCQEVSAEGGTVRFHSDRGAGDFADFTVR